MAYRLRAALGSLPGLTEKRVFGGISLVDAAWSERLASGKQAASERQLIRYAYASEQAAQARTPTTFLTTVHLEA